jgi:hypothetical protein
MIIFGLILTTFESSSIFGGSWGSIENWLEPQTEPPSGNLACPNLLKPLKVITLGQTKSEHKIKIMN